MDVRCENCGTEYVLDEARLKPGGVTVKCTSCGHMFKIRKRTLAGGIPLVRPATPSGSGVASQRSQSPGGAGVGGGVGAGVGAGVGGGTDRNWVIRLDNGDTRTCHELATLQEWIAEGVCSPDSLISRTGKSWKRFGDIPELAKFFDGDGPTGVLDSSRKVGSNPAKRPAPPRTEVGLGAAGMPSRLPRPPSVPPPPPARIVEMAAAAESGRTNVAASTPPSSRLPLPVPVPPTESMPAMPAMPSPTPQVARAPSPSPTDPSMDPTIPVSKPKGNSPAPSTGQWATEPVRPMSSGSVSAGPSAGSIRPQAREPEFSGAIRASNSGSGGFRAGQRGVADFLGDDESAPVVAPSGPPSRLGLWIVIGALLTIGGAGAALYFFVLSTPSPKRPVAIIVDAQPTLAGLVDARLGDKPDVALPNSQQSVATLALRADLVPTLREALDSFPAGDVSPETTALRARITIAIAQAQADEAALLTDAKRRRELESSSKQLVLDSVQMAQRAVKATPKDASANLAMADVLRLQGKSSREVERYLSAAETSLEKDPNAADLRRELVLQQGQLLLRDGKRTEARATFASLDAGPRSPGSLEITGDVRPRLQTVLAFIAEGNRQEAEPLLESVLKASPQHAVALAAQSKLTTLVSTADPMPPELGSGSDTSNNGNSSSTGSSSGGVDLSDSFDRVLSRANQLAERSCSQAMPYFQRALTLKPLSVEALSGAGYCHLDAGQFSSAYSKFNAALAISPRYERALWGMAESYQQQGNTERAIEAYQKYLKTYPSSTAAKKQLSRLGVSVSDTNSGSGTGSSTGSDSGSTEPAEPPPVKPPLKPPVDDPPSDDSDGPAAMP